MTQRIRPYQQAPYGVPSEMADWANWVTAAINATVAPILPLNAPTVTAAAKSGAVYLTWNEVPGAASYNVYVNTSASLPSAPLASVIAVPGNPANAYLAHRPDTNAYYWAVQTVAADGTLGGTSAWVKTAAGQIRSSLTPTAFGKNQATNPGFESNVTGTPPSTNLPVGGYVCDAWVVERLDTAAGITVLNAQLYTGSALGLSPRSGAYAGLIVNVTGITLPTSGLTYTGQLQSTAQIPASVGDIARISGYVAALGNIPASCSLVVNLGLAIFSSTGAFLGAIVTPAVTAITAGFTLLQGALAIPTTIGGGTPAFVSPVCQMQLTNNANNNAITQQVFALFDDLKVVLQNTAFDLTPVSTSGTIVGANPLSQSGTSTTINVASATVQFADGQVTYNSGSVNPGAYGKFYVYAKDATYSGGAVTYITSTTYAPTFSDNGYVFFGIITTVAGGGATGSNGGAGGGRTAL